MPDVRVTRGPSRRFGALLLSMLMAGAACGSPAPSSTVTQSPSAATAPASSASPVAPSAMPSGTPGATSSPAPSPSSPPAATLTRGLLAITVTDSVRMRSKPSVANDSRKYAPLLPTGARLIVTGGPVVASDYTWIEVSPLDVTLDGGIDSGWVAVADHDGAPWVAVDPNPTPGFELVSSTVKPVVGTLSAAKLEATQANAFGIDLYRRLLASGQFPASDGIVFSPTSIVDALSMARAGAKGETATQMDKVLRASGWDQLSLGVASLDAQLASRDATWADDNGVLHALALRLANTAFAQRGFPIQQTYLERIGKTSGAGIALVDFEQDTQGAIDAINGWVKTHTLGKIPVIVDTNSITPATRLALANAIYLKANWAHEFNAGDTANRAFTLFDGSKVSVPMMQQWGGQDMGLASGAGWKATQLYYRGASDVPLAMTLILPGDLRAFERSLSPAKLATVLTGISTEERRLQNETSVPGDNCGTYAYQVQLGLPKFGIDTKADLAALLGSMGMRDAITSGVADFTGINPDAGLFISGVIHKATIDVDEKGTTAAAVTVVGMDTGGCTGPQPAKTVKLTFNRPFLFLIRDVKTGAIVFMGRVTDPTRR